ALERHAVGEARVIPILLRHVLLKRTPIRELKALPKDGKPVRSWQDEDEALLNVAEGIEKAVSELLALQWYREGDALCESRQFEEAFSAHEQALRLGTDPPDSNYEIVRRLHALGVTQVSSLEYGSTQDGKGQYWHYPELSVYWSPETGIHAVSGPIRDKWKSLDWEHGIL